MEPQGMHITALRIQTPHTLEAHGITTTYSRKVHMLNSKLTRHFLVILNVMPIILALFSNKIWPLLFSNYYHVLTMAY